VGRADQSIGHLLFGQSVRILLSIANIIGRWAN